MGRRKSVAAQKKVEIEDEDYEDDVEEEEKENPFQNLKWRKSVIGTQLTNVIIKLKKTHGLTTTPTGFSWRNFEVHGVRMMPTALDQQKTELCIIFSLLGIFRFQLNLLETEMGEINFEPSFDYMVRMLNRMSLKTDLDGFLWKLRINNISDKEEFASVNSLAKKHIKRFAIEYQYINPKADDGLDSIKEAIDTAGGVLISMLCYQCDADDLPIFENGAKKVIWVYDYKKVKGTKKRKRVKQKLCHVVFGHSWKIENEEVIFQYLNSYGTDYNADEGHGVCEIDEIEQVFTPQISFDESGFLPKPDEPTPE